MKKLTYLGPLLLLIITFILFSPGVTYASTTNSVNDSIFGPNVFIFDDSMNSSEIQNVITSTHNSMTGEGSRGEFSSNRYALLFKPGEYDVDIHVGFYTTIAGIGLNPDDVKINGDFDVNAQWANGNGTRNFWRSVENFSMIDENNSRWAVSQAAPMRRMHFNHTLDLFDLTSSNQAGWVSGGFIADSMFDENVAPGSQQQFFSRNNHYNEWQGSNWNTVLVGDENPPTNLRPYPEQTYTIIDETPVIREKPYLYIDNSGQYNVFVPSLQEDSKGVTWIDGETPGTSISINDFFIANPSHTAQELNAALSSGKHLFFTPGIYQVDEPIEVNNPNTIIFGLGYPTITPVNGVTAMKIADVDGVQLAGILFDAGYINSEYLLQVGPENSSLRHVDNPTSLHDVFFRVGGYHVGKADVSVVINSHDVIVDHFWVWRADHGSGVGWNTNTGKNGLIVNGNDITIYALFVEHYQEYQTIWNGNGGRVYFYQNEIPYDIPNQTNWMSHDGTKNGYAAYKVSDLVTSHELWGAGSYSYFRDAAVKLHNSFEFPDTEGVNAYHLTTVWLNGKSGSEITHVINEVGNRVYNNGSGMVVHLKQFIGGDNIVPSVPTNLTATAKSSTEIKLTWDASTDNIGVTSYEIYRNGFLKGTSTTNSFTDTSLNALTTYIYTVKAKDASGNVTLASKTARATTKSPEIVIGTLGWTFTSTGDQSSDSNGAMIDNNLNTRWSTGTAMAPNMSIILDMKKVNTFERILLDANDSNDYARGYQVYVSNDGVNWGEPIASGPNNDPKLYIDFPEQSARYIKVVQTGSSSSWWSIHELKVYDYPNVDTDQPTTDDPSTDKLNHDFNFLIPLIGITFILLAGSSYFFIRSKKQ